MTKTSRIFIAELFGTAVLMIGGPGAAILAGNDIGRFGVALSFGLTLLVLAYVIGPVSGCHINPAVTIAQTLAKKIDSKLAPVYIGAQLVGSVVGGGIVWMIAHGQPNFISTGAFGANGYGKCSMDRVMCSPAVYSLAAVAIAEIVLTALLCIAVLSTTLKKFPAAMGGVVVGLTLALVHLISIPVDNTSVNPARSFGSAIFSGSDALMQLWAFIVFPIIGAAVGFGIWKVLLEPTDNEVDA